MFKKLSYWGYLFIIALSLTACSQMNTSTLNVLSSPSNPQKFYQAIKSSSQHLLKNIYKDSKNKHWIVATQIVINPFINDIDGKEIEANRQINQIIIKMSRSGYNNTLRANSRERKIKGHYVINGTMSLSVHPKTKKKLYYLTTTATEIWTKKVLATSRIWITDHHSTYKNKPVALSKAIHLSNKHLLKGIRWDRKFRSRFDPVYVTLAPFGDGQHAKGIIADREIARNLKNILKRRYNRSILRLSAKHKDYIIEGKIFSQRHYKSKKIIYKLQTVAKDIRSGRLIASSDIWIANNRDISLKVKSKSFKKVVNQASKHLLKEVHKDRVFHNRYKKVSIVLQPLIKRGSKKELAASQYMNNIIQKTSQRQYPSTVNISSKNKQNSDYHIQGKLHKNKNNIKVSLSTKETRTGKVVSTSSITLKKRKQALKLTPIAFNLAAQKSNQHILDNIEQYRLFNTSQTNSRVVINPFVDVQSLDEIGASKLFVNSIIRTSRSRKNIHVSILQQQTLKQSHYSIQGYISLERHHKRKVKMYRIRSVTREISTGKIIATTDTWINNKNIPYQRIPEYRDRPIYPPMKNAIVHNRTSQLFKHKSPSVLKRELSINAILNDAGSYYAKRQYAKALQLYRSVEGKHHEKDLRIYAGLYLSNLRMGNIANAERAFKKLIQWSIKTSNGLSMKFLFNVNSTSFSGNAFLQKQYRLWLKNLSQLLVESKQCFYIEGHSSHTGSVAYNKQLSLQRATSIIDIMKPRMHNNVSRLKAIGRGFSNNISGLGTDDHHDAIDRRVEFVKGGC